jgi:hypothetical protein
MPGAPLTFAAIDGIAFAADRGRLNGLPATTRYDVGPLGPFMELRQLAHSGLLPEPAGADWLDLGPAASFYEALRSGHRKWIGGASRLTGFFRTTATWSDNDTDWVGFGLTAQKAAAAGGFPRRIAAQFVAALEELVGNVHEHSGASASGIAAFSAGNGEFEFVVADQGIGVLESLRSGPEYKSLADHGEALRLALTDGVSRHGKEAKRGNGFRPIFVGLANLNGTLRFRSGDHAQVIDGQRIDMMSAKTAQKVPMGGFLVSVACRYNSTTESS